MASQISPNIGNARDKSDSTDRALERAALTLLTGGGLLAGFTMQQVGDAAGVTKGLVYHYFGDRQALLRSALRHGAMELQGTILAIPYSSYDRRLSAFAKAALAYPAAVQLMTLLLIDRDPRLRVMPLRGVMLQNFERDIRENRLPASADFEALLGLQNSLVYGYVLFRDGMARQMGVARDVLDARFRRLVSGGGAACSGCGLGHDGSASPRSTSATILHGRNRRSEGAGGGGGRADRRSGNPCGSKPA